MNSTYYTAFKIKFLFLIFIHIADSITILSINKRFVKQYAFIQLEKDAEKEKSDKLHVI